MNSPRLSRRTFLLICGALLLFGSETLEAQGRTKKRKPRKVASWGELGKQIKGSDFYEIAYYKKTGSGPKAKVKKTKAFIKITSKSLIYQDLRTPIERLKPGEDIRIFGKPVTRRVPGRAGVPGGVDSQIQTARVVMSGDLQNKLPFNKEFKDPKSSDHKWIDAQVTKSEGGLLVQSFGAESRVTMAKGAPVLRRLKVDSKRLKKRVYVQFFAYTTTDRPETGKKSDEDKDSFRAAMLVILDRGSLASVYPMMWKR